MATIDPRPLGAALTGLVIAAFIGACAAPPPGQRSGRVDIGDTTPAEARDIRPLPADLVAFSDQLAQTLVADMADEDRFTRPYDQRLTILYGDIRNETGIVSTNDFEVVRERMKNRLDRSQLFRQNFRFLTSRQRLEELQRRELGQDLSGIDSQGRVTNPRIDPEDTLLLNGTMYRIGRGDANYYLMTFELVRFTDGEIVWVKDYESKRW